MPAPKEFSSPARALARQAFREKRVQDGAKAALLAFMGETRRLALRDGMALSAGTVAGVWQESLVEHLAKRVSAKEWAILEPSFRDSVLPDEIFSSVMAVLTSAAEQNWSKTDTKRYLNAALSLESGPTELTAGAPKIKRDAAGRPIYRATARLDEGGMNWYAKLKMEARTHVTGMDGLLTKNELADQGFTRKMWITRRDKKVRDTHVAADRQVVPVDDMFSVGSSMLMFPGDPSGEFEDIVNCRCVITGTRWREKKAYL
jgi:hypothetical protein